MKSKKYKPNCRKLTYKRRTNYKKKKKNTLYSTIERTNEALDLLKGRIKK